MTVTAPASSAAPGSAAPEAAEPAPAEPAGKVKVPNGVGKDYRSAQGAWRGAGLVVVPANDATGANRVMVLDSNWVVISQTPKAGTTVPTGAEIKATVKKYTDN